ncbi:MAG: SPFH domain-containing protein, partial [bacterium]|nr:SPFH domain-containing protein [bacterium]
MRFPFRFYRGGPTDHVVKYVAGERRAEGRGKMFLVGPRTTIVRVPTTDLTIPFAFTELTSDGQEVVIQGELLAGLILDEILKRRDFSINVADGSYESEDPDKIEDDARHALQVYVRREVLGKSLEAALTATAGIQDAVRDAISKDAKAFTAIGVEVRNLFVTSVSPANLDLKRALEAKAREEMLADADRALA